MFYRKIRNDKVYYKGKYYVFPRHMLYTRSGENRSSVERFYNYLERKPRVGFKETPDSKVIKAYDTYLIPIFGSHSSLYYWYEEGYYYSQMIDLV